MAADKNIECSSGSGMSRSIDLFNLDPKVSVSPQPLLVSQNGKRVEARTELNFLRITFWEMQLFVFIYSNDCPLYDKEEK